MAVKDELRHRVRADYGYSLDYRTRWADNDVYGHLNNSIYYFLFDSVVNAYLTSHCSQSPSSPQIGLVVHSHCDYFSSTGFPAILDLCLRVKKMGTSSVAYEIAVFEQEEEKVKAVGEFVHVFVERGSRRPSVHGMSDGVRKGLQRLMSREESKL